MVLSLGLRRLPVLLGAAGMLAVAPSAVAGPWSSLPEAVAALEGDATDLRSEDVLRAAEESLLTEARAGRLAAAATLMDAYESLVTPLPDGEDRSGELRSRTAAALLAYGDRVASSDPESAGAAWALAAELDPMPAAVVRLEELLLPPPNPEPGEVWRSTVDGAELVFVPGAEIELGCIPNERDCRADEDGGPVEVEDFWIERTEVTRARYRLCVEAGACTPPNESPAWDGPRRGDEPVTGVTWRQAREYATWVGRLLPSEAVWQRAARDDEAGGRFPWGRGRSRGAANLYETADEDTFEELAPVASFPPTGYGLYDMGGNVWEWCADRYHRDLAGAPRDGRPWVRGGWGRTLRGGSWRRTMDLARAASRTWHEEDYFADDVGFRCVAEPRDRVPAQQLVQLAVRVYPWRVAPGAELDGSGVSPSDREYLELRTLTWLVLEGRITEALPLAVHLLKRNRSNQVALELLEQIEREMEVGIRRGEVTTVRAAISRYRSAVAGDRRLASRLARHERELASQSRASVEVFAGRGEYGLAGVTLELALDLAAGDPSVTATLSLTEPPPGTRKFSARDGKLMVWVPSGQFRMGASPGDGAANYDEHPARRVTVEGFWLDAHEVTNADYRRCVDDGACTPPTRSPAFEDPAMDEHPVLFLTWFQAYNYAEWAGKRLPSEAEWERAARGGTGSRYPWGGEFQQMRVNGQEGQSDDPFLETAPVGHFDPNRWGLHDMLGNAAEWVADIYQRNFWGGPRDQRPWYQLTGEWVERERVIRGGSFLSGPNKLRVSSRDHKPPHETARDIGFRCAADR